MNELNVCRDQSFPKLLITSKVGYLNNLDPFALQIMAALFDVIWVAITCRCFPFLSTGTRPGDGKVAPFTAHQFSFGIPPIGRQVEVESVGPVIVLKRSIWILARLERLGCVSWPHNVKIERLIHPSLKNIHIFTLRTQLAFRFDELDIVHVPVELRPRRFEVNLVVFTA